MGSTSLRKLTTRHQRPYEVADDVARDLDLEFVDEQDFDRRLGSGPSYVYTYAKYRYGFRKADLDAALQRHEFVFVIVRDREIIKTLKADYSKTRVIPVYIYTDKDEIQKRLRSQSGGRADETVAFRMGRLKLAWENYIQEPELYEEVIINTSAREDFNRLIDGLIRKYRTESQAVLAINAVDTFSMIPSLVGHKAEMLRRLRKYPFNRNVFLMMRFREENRLLSDFICKCLKKGGLNGVRADHKEWRITKDVYNPIAVLMCCKYGIALFDSPDDDKESRFSPNVMYELGMMHLQKKECLILKHSALPQSPFDLIKDLYDIYKRDLDVETIVEDWVSRIVS